MTLKDCRMKVGSGKVKKTSVKELAVEFKASEEGQLLFKGGSLSAPRVEHVKEKSGLSVEDHHLQREGEVAAKSYNWVSRGRAGLIHPKIKKASLVFSFSTK